MHGHSSSENQPSVNGDSTGLGTPAAQSSDSEAAFLAGDSPGQRAAQRRRRRLALLGVLGGLVLGSLAVLLVFAALWIRRQDALPTLTQADFDAALKRWESAGPKSYQLDLTLNGRQPGRIHVEVRRGETTAMTRDGHTPSQKRTWEYWTVPGQFDTIERELEMAADPAVGIPSAPGATIVQQAEFDAKLGYPRRYRRMVLGSNLEIDWEITRFEPLAEP